MQARAETEMNPALKFAKWLAPAAALFALAGALLAPAEAGVARRPSRAAQEGRRRAEPEANTTVRGRAVYDDTSRPVRRARVVLIKEGGEQTQYNGLTDSRGEFRIAGVRAGSYIAYVDAPGLLSPNVFTGLLEMLSAQGPAELAEWSKFFDAVEADGRQDVSVTVRARRGGAVSGRVKYADEDPAVGITVGLIRKRPGGQFQRLRTSPSTSDAPGVRADDRGVFRLTGLPPGEYFVCVTEPASHGAEASGRDAADPGGLGAIWGLQLLTTFHPSATSLKQAAAVKVEAGAERADVDVTIPDRPLRAVSGVVLARRDRRPVARARVSIRRRDDPLADGDAASHFYAGYDSAPNATKTDENGRWHFKDIPDGPYTIEVKPAEESEPDAANWNAPAAEAEGTGGDESANSNLSAAAAPRRKRKPYTTARREVEVADGDLSDLTIELNDGGRVSGTVVVEGGGDPPEGYVYLLRAPEPGAGFTPADAHNAQVEKGRFDVEGLPAGRFFFQMGAYPPPEGLYLKSITLDGRDFMRLPLELAEGAEIDGVRVVYTGNAAKLLLSAVGGDGRPARRIGFLLVPEPLSKWAPFGQQTHCWVDAGTCTVSAAPGEYRAIALPRSTSRETYEAEVRRRFASAPRVALRAGETSEVEVVAPDN